ncbi:FMN-linked oxidoreductases superfamily protein isoform 1 [Tripterygium wilfordii]|uniref:tRNA-dihydrouridine(47) synthase [NAD(P)(+)] n=1 Tax=Tripterygium wilfordii TaxID=458696 RepID=A0A7J7BZ49_TRIWF|nr:tRNA-dihydrouridine(47) synthase [NAD(P)(+)]-like isoform X1 [Tripterygium wilfordii]KAF5727179.1 FMN-linked oxidoreductases superfamily protein isoform 1 [Tripterygium wilfordii]
MAESVFDGGLPATIQEEPQVLSSNGAHQTPEELVAKAIAPIKREFLRPPPTRTINQNVSVSNANAKAPQSGLVREKKSRRQLKRERRQERQSALNLCPEVAKTGNVSSCSYGDKCRSSHDVEAFKAQKPADIEGECPFVSREGPCPFGLACRFSGTHKDGDPSITSTEGRRSAEINGLNKDVQKLLWKNKMKFSKADAVLKSLGLLGHKNCKGKLSKEKEENGQIVSKDSDVIDENDVTQMAADSDPSLVAEDNNPDGVSASNEQRPLKKAKSVANDESSITEVDNDVSMPVNDVEKICIPSEPETVMDALPESDKSLKPHHREKKLIDFKGKLYLAPLTTVGNLPFRRLCKVLGADVTCGEMAMCTNLLQGQASEWALLRRHSSEDFFGVQICGAYPDTVARTVELIDQECTVDFIDINMGCPIDIVVNKGAGSALLTKPMRMKSILEASFGTVGKPITVKVRTGYFEGKNRIDSLIADIGNWGATAVTIHGRTRQQRYSKLADWDYIYQCARRAPDTLEVLGNGDVFSYLDWNKRRTDCPELSSCMIARGALIKPWIFTEIRQQRHWDISSGERFNILKDYVRFGLEHWGSDSKGVETTRHFLLEWLSYTCRYIPVGLLDVIPQRLNWRPPAYYGRDDLETLMASDSASDWIRISEMLLGKVPDGFTFAPKHKSNGYDRAENG